MFPLPSNTVNLGPKHVELSSATVGKLIGPQHEQQSTRTAVSFSAAAAAVAGVSPTDRVRRSESSDVQRIANLSSFEVGGTRTTSKHSSAKQSNLVCNKLDGDKVYKVINVCITRQRNSKQLTVAIKQRLR